MSEFGQCLPLVQRGKSAQELWNTYLGQFTAARRKESNRDSCRVVFIHGPPGVGKSRLNADIRQLMITYARSSIRITAAAPRFDKDLIGGWQTEDGTQLVITEDTCCQWNERCLFLQTDSTKKWIDLGEKQPDYWETWRAGIYKIEGDTLTISLSEEGSALDVPYRPYNCEGSDVLRAVSSPSRLHSRMGSGLSNRRRVK